LNFAAAIILINGSDTVNNIKLSVLLLIQISSLQTQCGIGRGKLMRLVRPDHKTHPSDPERRFTPTTSSPWRWRGRTRHPSPGGRGLERPRASASGLRAKGWRARS